MQIHTIHTDSLQKSQKDVSRGHSYSDIDGPNSDSLISNTVKRKFAQPRGDNRDDLLRISDQSDAEDQQLSQSHEQIIDFCMARD